MKGVLRGAVLTTPVGLREAAVAAKPAGPGQSPLRAYGEWGFVLILYRYQLH